ncbi:MAG: chitobiase/beta-hexosaminidase C-terminal domain-containing protein [Paludibacteraceae bacterium]|nr:chitobiase/beta-hexosaminidase C-terminal domain-containing protein [Paludibacteraceae bacterium]
MRKFKLFLSMLMLIAFSVGNVWAEVSTLTFTAACGGSGTADDGVEWTVTSDGSESNFDSGKGIHYGTGKAAVQYIKLTTSGISGTITKVVVNASAASGVSATASVTVGGDAFGGDAQSISTSAADYTFNGSASGEIVVTVTKPSSATKAIYCKSVAVTYSEGGSSSETTVKTLKSIAVEGMTTSYEVGAAFSFDGTCTATYSVTVNDEPQADEEETVTPTSVSTPDMTVAGDKTITVSYTEDDVTKTTTYDITVSAAEGDKLTRETTGVSGTNYTGWSGISGASGAEYAGNSAGGNDAIQLRSDKSTSGIVSTATGGLIKKVKVAWNSNTASGRTLNVYGSNTAYTAASDLYGENSGTLLGTIVYGTSTQLEITDEYEYVGVRSNSGAMYLTSITFVWEPGKQLESIAVKNNPNKVSYNIGDAFDAAGLVITATYDDSSSEDIAYAGNEDKFSFTGFDSSAAAAAQAITVTYGNKSTTFNVEIKDVTLQTVTVSGTPATTSYTAGDTFDPTDLTVMGHYSDNSDAPITSGITWSYPDANNTLEVDQTSIRVVATVEEIASEAYTVNGLTVTAAPLVASWVASEHYNETTDMTAETVAFGPNNNFSIVFGAGTNTQNAPKYYTTGTAVRAYGGNTFALSSSDFKFKEIVVSFSSGEGSNEITTNVGAYETGTWTGNSKEVVFTIGGTTGHRRIASITVTYVEAQPSVATPTFSVAEGTYFETQNVTITTATAGATIYYTTDGTTTPTTESSVYSDPIAVSTNMTIKAIAVKDGLENSAVASATYAMGPIFASLEELVAADLTSNTMVKVSFSNVAIKKIDTNKKYVTFDIQKEEKDIEIYFSAETLPTTWVVGGTLSGTILAPWKRFAQSSNLVCWELAPESGWQWTNLTYNSPITKEIDHVTVTGTATKTAYVDGEVFDPTGLIVTLYYTDETSEVVTEGITWAPTTALTEGTTSVNVTATVNEVTSATYPVSITVSEIPTKTIAEFIGAAGTRCYLEGTVSNIANTTYGNFDLTDESGTIYVYGCLTSAGESGKFNTLGISAGDKIKVIAEEYLLYQKPGNPDKDEAVNVVFVSKVSAATIAIDDINMTVGDELLLANIVATVTPDAAQSAEINYAVTEGDAVTIAEGKITAVAEGEATITASIEAGEGYLAGSTTFTVTVSPAPVPFEGDYFVKVDDNSDLTAGEYLIVYEDGSLAFNGGLETLDATSNYVAVTFENGKIQGTDAVLAATFTIKLAGTIQSQSGYYIGRTGNSNGMNTSKDEAYTNAISIDGGGNAVILASGGAYMRFNSTSGQERFRYFKSDSYTGQKAIQLYKKENAEPVYETVRTELEPNAYYTMCLDKAVTAVRGGSIWRVLSKAQNGTDIILEEVSGTLDAGRPYIFYATADKLEVVYTGEAVNAPVDDEENNGLIGSFDQVKIDNNPDYYIIYKNALYYVNTDNVYVGAHRAYLDMTGVPAYSNEPVQGNAPRRRVAMAVHGPQVATGIDALNASEAPVKVLINGQLFIIRGEKMFDAKGQLVK